MGEYLFLLVGLFVGYALNIGSVLLMERMIWARDAKIAEFEAALDEQSE